MTQQIKVRQEGSVEIIEFCNPPMNSTSHIMIREFYQELVRVKKDDKVRDLRHQLGSFSRSALNIQCGKTWPEQRRSKKSGGSCTMMMSEMI